MQNDKTSTLLNDLENLSSELGNLSNTPAPTEAASNSEDAVGAAVPKTTAIERDLTLDDMIAEMTLVEPLVKHKHSDSILPEEVSLPHVMRQFESVIKGRFKKTV